jgi:ribonuclease HII
MLVGIDEVGRGCWAGPLVAGAVLLDEPIAGLRDSKKLSKAQRIRLDADIRISAVAFGLGWVTPKEVDMFGLTLAVKTAMQRALFQITVPYDQVIIDGNLNFLRENPKASSLIRADDSVPAVSAASIIAKVARDNFMVQAAKAFPGYGFEAHVGYGTAAHLRALQLLGACDIHRMSYKPIQALPRAPTTRRTT